MIKNQEFTYWERKNGADIALLDITDGKAKIAYRRGVWIGPKFEIKIIAWPFEGETFPVQLDKDREEYIEVFGEKLYLGFMRMGDADVPTDEEQREYAEWWKKYKA